MDIWIKRFTLKFWYKFAGNLESLYSAKEAGNEGLKPVSEKVLNQDRWKMLALRLGD